jgi:hypothetical protein
MGQLDKPSIHGDTAQSRGQDKHCNQSHDILPLLNQGHADSATLSDRVIPGVYGRKRRLRKYPTVGSKHVGARNYRPRS